MLDLADRRTEKARKDHAAATEGLPFQRGDVLYHSVHGLCVVKGVLGKPSGSEGMSYWIEPSRPGKHLARYFVDVEQAHLSGFHRLMTVQETEEIFESFRLGKMNPEENPTGDLCSQLRIMVHVNTPQAFAKMLLKSVSEKSDNTHGEGKLVKRAADALSQEIALVLKVSPKKACLMIRRNLRSHLSDHSWVDDILTPKD
ncbi:MAG: hypothetical protein WC133_01285 [Candidatus Omnitrophota bacterium]